MRKEKQYVKIGGIDFLLLNGYVRPTIRYTDIYMAYDKPSIYKIDIWRSWLDWFIENNQYSGYIGIASKNCMIFTICGVIHYNNIEYGFYITKTRHEAWVI